MEIQKARLSRASTTVYENGIFEELKIKLHMVSTGHLN